MCLCVLFHLLPEEETLVTTDKALIYEYTIISLGIISVNFLDQYFLVNPRYLGYPASDSQPSRQCQAWDFSHGVGLMLHQILVANHYPSISCRQTRL